LIKIRSKKTAVIVAALTMTALAAGLAQAEIAQKADVRVSFDGSIAPQELPRGQEVPVTVTVDTHIDHLGAGEPPKLLRISLAINRNGHIDYEGLPKCHYKRIQPSNNQEALDACGDSQVGTGFFSANVLLPEQSPFPSQGKILAFNGEVLGHPVIFAHIYGTKPVPTSFVLPFVVRHTNGKYATTLVAYLPKVKANWGFITGVRLKLHRTFRFRGHDHTYLSASCAAPKGFSSAVFSFARSEFVFAGGTTVSPSLTRTCKVR
jgi:hypothetical protein